MTTYYVDPNAPGANDGGGSGTNPDDPTFEENWYDAWTDIASAAAAVAAGDVVYCRGEQTITSTTDIVASGNQTSGFIKFIGCNSSTGEIDGSYFVIDINSAADVAGFKDSGGQDYVWFENIEIKNGGDAGEGGWHYTTANPENWVYVNCYVHDCSGPAWYLYRAYGTHIFIRCRAESCNYGFYYPYVSGRQVFVGCIAKDNTIDGWGTVHDDIALLGCISHNNGTNGLDHYTGYSPMLIAHCVFDGNSNDGIAVDHGDIGLIFGCRITNNGGYAINEDHRVLAGYSYFSNNSSGDQNGDIDVVPYDSDHDTNEYTGTDGYVNRASDDFNLDDDATLRNFSIEID